MNEMGNLMDKDVSDSKLYSLCPVPVVHLDETACAQIRNWDALWIPIVITFRTITTR